MDPIHSSKSGPQTSESSPFGVHPLGGESESGFEGGSMPAVPFQLVANGDGETPPPTELQEGGTLLAPDGGGGTSGGGGSERPIQAKTNEAPVQMQEGDDDDLRIPFTVTIDRTMTQEEFKVAALTQIFGQVIEGDWRNLQASYEPGTYTVNVAQALVVRHRGSFNESRGIDTDEDGGVQGAAERAERFAAMPQGEGRTSLTDEIDRRYYEISGVAEGTPIARGEEGRAALWRSIRDEVLFQHEHLQNLPPSVQQVIRRSTDGRVLTPRDYEQLFRIAQILENLPADQLTEYVAYISASTTDLNVLEQSIERYISERAERDLETVNREDIQTRLFGLEAVYEEYKNYISVYSSGVAGMILSTGLRESLLTNLQANGFASIEEFTIFIRNFEEAFERESQRITVDLLTRYEGTMFQQARRYQNISEVEALQAALRSGAADLAETHPIFNEEGLPDDRLIDREAWMAADSRTLQGLIQGHISRRKTDLTEARGRVEADSNLIYKIDSLLPLFYQQQNIAPDSIYDMIIRDKMRSDMIINIVVGVLGAIAAIALTVVSLGTATPAIVAAGAAVGAFGISAAFTYQEFQNYVIENDLAQAGLVDDPTIAWLVLSVVGAAVDMGAAVRAIRALSPAARALNASGDVAEFTRALRILQEAGEIDARIAAAANRAVAARQGFQEASTELGRLLRTAEFTGSEVYQLLVRMATSKLEQGVTSFSQFALELQRVRTLAGLRGMNPEELLRAKEAWRQAQVIINSAETPVDILSTSGRVIGRFSNGSHMEIISRGGAGLHGGDRIALATERTTTITGTLNDVNTVARRGAQLPGATMMGANPGGINILRSPRWAQIQEAHRAILEAGEVNRYWRTVTEEFWSTVNRPWLDDAIARGDQFRLVSDPADDTARFVTHADGTFILDDAGERITSIFGMEVEYLISRGYTILADGTAVPPG